MILTKHHEIDEGLLILLMQILGIVFGTALSETVLPDDFLA